MKKLWKTHIVAIDELLGKISFRDGKGDKYLPDEGFRLWKKLTVNLKNRKKSIYLIGNGASASMASHFAADLAKNAYLHTEVFSDLSLMTAISNDMGYEWIFAEPLRRRSNKGDMLVAISSSGESENILLACRIANERKLKVVTLSAMSTSNRLRHMGHLNVHVPAESYGLAETCHSVILHHWMDMLEAENAK